jgi:hypothetical protein
MFSASSIYTVGKLACSQLCANQQACAAEFALAVPKRYLTTIDGQVDIIVSYMIVYV